MIAISLVDDAYVIIRDSLENETTLEEYTPGVYFTYDIDPIKDMKYSIEVIHEETSYKGDEIFPVKKHRCVILSDASITFGYTDTAFRLKKINQLLQSGILGRTIKRSAGSILFNKSNGHKSRDMMG